MKPSSWTRSRSGHSPCGVGSTWSVARSMHECTRSSPGRDVGAPVPVGPDTGASIPMSPTGFPLDRVPRGHRGAGVRAQRPAAVRGHLVHRWRAVPERPADGGRGLRWVPRRGGPATPGSSAGWPSPSLRPSAWPSSRARFAVGRVRRGRPAGDRARSGRRMVDRLVASGPDGGRSRLVVSASSCSRSCWGTRSCFDVVRGLSLVFATYALLSLRLATAHLTRRRALTGILGGVLLIGLVSVGSMATSPWRDWDGYVLACPQPAPAAGCTEVADHFAGRARSETPGATDHPRPGVHGRPCGPVLDRTGPEGE